MALVSTVFDSRWLSAKHVGGAKPYIYVGIRRGHFERKYDYWQGGDVNAVFQNGVHSAQGTWVATWVPDTSYVEVPNVYRVQLQQSLGQTNGITTLTMDIENIMYVARTGPGGLIGHLIERGYMAPLRGYSSPSRQVPPLASQNEWYKLFERNAQILVKAGYGPDTAVPVFTGLIDKNQLTGNPARMTITGRDFGKALADQNAFGQVIDPGIPDPIYFADRRANDTTYVVGGGAAAVDHQQGYPARNVVDDNLSTSWRSGSEGDSNHTKWIEIHLPEGRYEDFFLAPAFENHECFVSLKATRRSGGKAPTFNGVPQPTGWLNVPTGSNGGSVPGANGGIPYIRHMQAIQSLPRQYSMLGSFVVGDNSILRISLRNLQRSSTDRKYHAGVRTLRAIRRQRDKDAVTQQWILVDDLADIVRCVLRWAGFKTWEVQNTGVRLQKHDTLVYNRQKKLMDIVQDICKLTGFVFFINDPENDTDSIGVPTFRRPNAMVQNPGLLRGVRDTDMLTSATANFDDANLGSPIRVRGNIAKQGQGGRTLGADTTKRFHGFYVPPWSDRLAGLLKHVIHYEPLMTSNEDCQYLALLIAFNEALSSSTATVECPANPAVELDGQFAVVDNASGLQTRIYVTDRTQVFQTGGGTSGGTTGTTRSSGISQSSSMSWFMTLGGALLDTPDVQDVLNDLVNFQNPGTDGGPVTIDKTNQTFFSENTGPNYIYPTDKTPTAAPSWPQKPR